MKVERRMNFNDGNKNLPLGMNIHHIQEGKFRILTPTRTTKGKKRMRTLYNQSRNDHES